MRLARRTTRILAATAISTLLGACRPDRDPWNVLIVTFDTTRADALGCYGNPHKPTPHLDRLASEGVLFEHALTAVPITTPSHSTLFTGTYPTAHGVRDNGRFKLAEGRQTLAELLKRAGYSTGAAVGAFPLTRNWGLAQGFDFYDDHVAIAAEDELGRRSAPHRMFFDERPAPLVNDAALRFLRNEATEPFFAWVHYWDPHQPHKAPSPFAERFAQNGYEAEIAFADSAFGVLLDELSRRGVYDRTVVVALADHGEGNGEHGEETHSMLVYDGTLRVPLVMRAPGAPAGLRIAERVGTVDVAPTILELLDLAVPAEMQGRSLARFVRGTAGSSSHPDDRRPYYAESLSPRLSFGWGELRALFLGDLKLIHGPRVELYDLSADPREIENLAPGPRVDELAAQLERFVSRHADKSAADAVTAGDRESLEKLAALGYVSAAVGPVDVVEKLRRDGDPPQSHISEVSLWSRCKASLERRDFLAAREQATALVELDSASAFYRSLLVAALLGLDQIAEAADVAIHGPIERQNEEVFLAVAGALFRDGDTTGGLALADRIVAEIPSAPAHYYRAEMNGALDRFEAKERDLRAALELDPDHVRSRQSLAVHLAGSGRTALAEAEFRRLAREHPLDPSARFNLANCLLELGRLDEAEAEVDRALELEPRHWRAHLARLTILFATGRIDEAERLRERIRSEANDPQVVARAVAMERPR